jgi:ActR/RegA family two-component response regulator
MIEPDPLYLAQYNEIIESNLDVVITRTASQFDQPYQELDSFIPQIMITELNIKGKLQLSNIAKLRVDFPESQIIVISTISDIDLIVSLMKLGVRDFIQKNESMPSKLKSAIQEMQNEIIQHKHVQVFGKNIFNPDFFPLVMYKLSTQGIEYFHHDFSDFPEPLGTPLDDFLQTIGISVLVAIGQGHSYSEGCFNLPAANSKRYSTLLFSFKADDPDAIDPRMRKGYFVFNLFMPKILASHFPNPKEMEEYIPEFKSYFPNYNSMTPDRLSKFKHQLLSNISLMKNQQQI